VSGGNIIEIEYEFNYVAFNASNGLNKQPGEAA
jgi:hypothetical protein